MQTRGSGLLGIRISLGSVVERASFAVRHPISTVESVFDHALVYPYYCTPNTIVCDAFMDYHAVTPGDLSIDEEYKALFPLLGHLFDLSKKYDRFVAVPFSDAYLIDTLGLTAADVHSYLPLFERSNCFAHAVRAGRLTTELSVARPVISLSQREVRLAIGLLRQS